MRENNCEAHTPRHMNITLIFSSKPTWRSNWCEFWYCFVYHGDARSLWNPIERGEGEEKLFDQMKPNFGSFESKYSLNFKKTHVTFRFNPKVQ